jgi:hypothetical protein
VLGKLSYGLPDRLCCKPFDKLSYDCIRHIKQNYVETRVEKKGSPLQVESRKDNNTILSPTCTCASDESKVRLKTARQIPHTPVLRKDLKDIKTDAIERGRLRCVRTAYGNRVNDSSKVFEALAWDAHLHHSSTVSTHWSSESMRKFPTHRTTWQHDSNAQFCSSQRFAARNAQHLDRSLKLEATERTRKLTDVQRTFQLMQSLAREREKSSIAQNASNEWPHGLPVSYYTLKRLERVEIGLSLHTHTRPTFCCWRQNMFSTCVVFCQFQAARRNSAFQKGVTLGGLGYGQGAQSLPQPQYIALKSTMKLP